MTPTHPAARQRLLSLRPRRGIAAGLLAGFALCAAARPVDAGAIILDTITVRVYDSVGVSAADRGAAMKTAAAIFARADFDAMWVLCPPHDSRASRVCSTPLKPRDLVVRLANSTPLTRLPGDRWFGFAVVDPSTGTGTLATVFVDRVEWLASTSKAPRAEVLGRAIAHELGHLMLGSNDHAPRGIMHETWTPEELARNRPEEWQFSPAERASLRSRWAGTDATGRRAGARDPRTSSSGG